eukprot:TRINITY_DN16814_c0_g1_i1.p1 TRINITY_DN16814_c0_g1~~TRINITY_DN16814_c0_g1_i1.p1  ORF type:complete len:899 (+),score=232.89 TRINITY_DN16814_c0_g1_i1:207-2903(+)
MATLGCRAPFFTTRVGASVVSHESPDQRSRRGPSMLRSDPRSRFKDSYAEFAKHLQTVIREDGHIQTVNRSVQVQLGHGSGGGYAGSHGIGRHSDIEDDSHPHRQELTHLLRALASRAGMREQDPEIQHLEQFFIERLGERDHELQQLQMEHFETDTKNGQLRSALRASASALQHAATLMPPDMGFDVKEDEYLKQIQDLQNEVRDKDSKILGLARGTKEAQQLASRAERTLQKALGKWAPSAVPIELKRETFQAWAAKARNGDVQQKKAEQKFKDAMARGRESLQSGINKIVGGLAHTSAAQELRTALEAWRNLVMKGKFANDKKKMREQAVQQTLMHWAGDFKKTALPAILYAWLRLLDARQQEKTAEKQRKEHIRLSKEMEKQALARATMAMTASVGKLDPHAAIVILRAWRELILDARQQKALACERERADARASEFKNQARRRFAFLITEGQQAALLHILDAWHSSVVSHKRREEEWRLRNLEALFRAWGALVAAARETHLLEKEKEEYLKEKAALEDQIKANQKQNARRRASVAAFASSTGQTDPSVILRMSWLCWMELINEKRIREESDKERREYEKQFQERQQKELDKYRQRQSLVALQVSSKADGEQVELMRRLAWQCWRDFVDETKRERQLDARQRLFEDEMKKAEKEAEQLQMEAHMQHEKHKKVHEQRKAIFLMSLEQRDSNLILQAAWLAWREVMDDRKKTEVNVLRERLSQKETDLVQAVASLAKPTPSPEPAAPVPVKPPTFCEWLRSCLLPASTKKTSQVKAVENSPAKLTTGKKPGLLAPGGQSGPPAVHDTHTAGVSPAKGASSMATPATPPRAGAVHQPQLPGSASPGSPLPAGEYVQARVASSSEKKLPTETVPEGLKRLPRLDHGEKPTVQASPLGP